VRCAPRGWARHTAPVTGRLIEDFRAARRDAGAVVIEGFHALKHALRFAAELRVVVASDAADLDGLAAQLAPELAARLAAVQRVDEAVLGQLVPRAPRTGVVALARRPLVDPQSLLASPNPAPIVVLEEPRTMGNLGAVIRVAAAAGAAGVITTGTNDPWHPDAVRGAAGLHFALPVVRFGATDDDAVALVRAAQAAGRRVLALDPEGTELTNAPIPARAVLAFGTERDGLSRALLDAADARLRLPMEPGVSSLNLATSVAATLYAWRLSPPTAGV
jgi:RNA methyltransferase, TrmH family